MKNIYPLIVATLIAATTLTPARAQEADSVSVLDKKEQREQKRQEKKVLIESKRIQYHHDFRIGVGVVNLENISSGGSCGDQTSFGSVTPTFFVFYGYRIVGGLKVALTLGYNQAWGARTEHTSYNPETHEYTGSYVILDSKNFRISPSIQYEWYRRGLVTMYSEIGVTWVIPSNHRNVWNGMKTDSGFITPNLTLFGITVGSKHWFGAAEVLSFGSRGLFNIAAGYRF